MMIQRSVFRQSRALASVGRNALQSQRPGVLNRNSKSRALPLPPRLHSNLYSTATESASTESSPQAQPSESSSSQNKQASQSSEAALQRDIESKNKEIIDLKDKYLRSVAEFRNLQDRTKREVDSARNFAISRFARDLIESIDNLDRALHTVPQDKVTDPAEKQANPELVNLYDGLKMTDSVLMQTLKKHGLERFDPSEGEEGKAEVFNPNLHEATFMTKMEDREDGTVFATIQKGFLLNGRVVRAAKVGVVKNS